MLIYKEVNGSTSRYMDKDVYWEWHKQHIISRKAKNITLASFRSFIKKCLIFERFSLTSEMNSGIWGLGCCISNVILCCDFTWRPVKDNLKEIFWRRLDSICNHKGFWVFLICVCVCYIRGDMIVTLVCWFNQPIQSQNVLTYYPHPLQGLCGDGPQDLGLTYF